MYKNDNRNLCAFMQNCWHTLTDRVSKNSAKAFSSSSVLRAVPTNHRLWHSNFLFVGYTAVWWEFLFVYQVSVNKLPAITNACFVSLLISELQQTFCNHKKLPTLLKLIALKPRTGVAFYHHVYYITSRFKLWFYAPLLCLGY